MQTGVTFRDICRGLLDIYLKVDPFIVDGHFDFRHHETSHRRSKPFPKTVYKDNINIKFCYN